MNPTGERFDLIVADFGGDPEIVMRALRPLTVEQQARVLAAAKVLIGGEPGCPPNLGFEELSTRKKRLAAVIIQEIAVRAEELRRCGVRNPVAQAEKEAAERHKRASAAALNRWLRRHR